jgi:NAD(P)-dependent dehydrogenase (short-subunit alcohol dehydrogenase family)
MIMQVEQSKVVVITGATRGLGRAMAREFMNRDWTVVGCGASPGSVAEAEAGFPAPHRLDAVDVASDDEVSEWADEVMEAFGPPALLLNNAAVINRSAPLIALSAREFDEVIDVNIKGVANVIRHFAPGMIENGSGVIVNFSSGWGRSTSPEVAPYCATKWAIEGLTQALAQELPEGVAAIPLNPGVIDTDMLRSCFGGAASSYETPEEWAKRAVPTILSLDADDNGRPMSV